MSENSGSFLTVLVCLSHLWLQDAQLPLCVRVIKPRDRRCPAPDRGSPRGGWWWQSWVTALAVSCVLLCVPALLTRPLRVQSQRCFPLCSWIHFWCQNAFCALRFATVGQWLVAPLVRDAESEGHRINHPFLLWGSSLSVPQFPILGSEKTELVQHFVNIPHTAASSGEQGHVSHEQMVLSFTLCTSSSFPMGTSASNYSFFLCLPTHRIFCWVYFGADFFGPWEFWWTAVGLGFPFTASACSIWECFLQSWALVFLFPCQLGIDVNMSQSLPQPELPWLSSEVELLWTSDVLEEGCLPCQPTQEEKQSARSNAHCSLR